MIIKSNTDLMHWVYRPCTYSTYVRHEMFDIDFEAEEMKISIDDIDINYDEYKKELWNWLQEWFQDNLNNELPEWLQFINPKETVMYSPQYYNYGTDSINVELKVDKRKLNKFIKENKDLLNEYLKKYESRSGFISFTPSSYNELIKCEDIERVVMCVLDYLLKDIDKNPIYDFDSSIIYDNLIYPTK